MKNYSFAILSILMNLTFSCEAQTHSKKIIQTFSENDTIINLSKYEEVV